MKVFLIILAVLVVLTLLILSLSVGIRVTYDDGLNTKARILFIEKDIELSKILSFILFPDKAGEQAAEQREEKKIEENTEQLVEKPKAEPVVEKKVEEPTVKEDTISDATVSEQKSSTPAPRKPNYFQKLWNDEGVLGFMLLISNLLETTGSAVRTLYKGLHIHSLYVKMIIGGGDAFDVAENFGMISGAYYPLKGVILNGMKIDEYEDLIESDFIAPTSEYYFYIDASINVRLVLRMVFKAGFVFIKNFIKNK